MSDGAWPTSHLPSPTSHLLPPTSHLPPPTSYTLLPQDDIWRGRTTPEGEPSEDTLLRLMGHGSWHSSMSVEQQEANAVSNHTHAMCESHIHRWHARLLGTDHPPALTAA